MGIFASLFEFTDERQVVDVLGRFPRVGVASTPLDEVLIVSGITTTTVDDLVDDPDAAVISMGMIDAKHLEMLNGERTRVLHTILITDFVGTGGQSSDDEVCLCGEAGSAQLLLHTTRHVAGFEDANGRLREQHCLELGVTQFIQMLDVLFANATCAQLNGRVDE